MRYTNFPAIRLKIGLKVEKYFSEHDNLTIRNIRHRFRDPEQFTPQELQYLTLYKKGECVHRDPHKTLFFLQPKKKEGLCPEKNGAAGKNEGMQIRMLQFD